MILKAKHNFFIYPFFQKYAIWKIKRCFEKVNVLGEFDDRKLPVLILSNHVSWWDGFWISYLNVKLIHRKFHFMMLENQLRKFWFFNYTGGFSVNKNARSVLETIDYTAKLLADGNNMVMLFPQGEIQSIHNNNMQFQRGIDRIMKKLTNKIQILFVVNLTDYFSNPKPTLFQYIKEYEYSQFDFRDLEKQYQIFYNQSIENQIINANK